MVKNMRRSVKTTIALLFLTSCSADTTSIEPEAPVERVTAELGPGVVYSRFNRFQSTDAAGGDLYAESIAFRGNTLVVGAPGEDAVYVYRRQGNKRLFYEAQKLESLDSDTGFGTAVGISADNTIFVGEPRANVGETRSGRVRVYSFVQSQLRWEEGPDLRMMVPEYEAEFGSVLAAEGDRVVVGAPNHRRGADSGSVHTFRQSLADTWEYEGSLIVEDRMFGRALAIDGERIAIGGQGKRGEGASLQLDGAAYVYEWTTPDGWQQITKILGNERYGDAFGASLALEGESLAVGVGDSNGHIYIFERNFTGVNAWGEVARFDGAVGSNFGSNLDLEGGLLVAPSHVSDRAVQIFQRDNAGEWSEIGRIEGTESDYSYNYATLALIDGTTVIAAEGDHIDVSTPSQPLLPGAVHVYDTNRAPTVTNAQVLVSEDTDTEFSFGASDPDETDVLSMQIPDPEHGTIRGIYPRLRYKPDPDYYGTDEVEIVVVDEGGLEKIARVTFEILPVNDAPRSDERFAESTLTGVELELKATDPEGDEVTFEVYERPQHGVLEGVLPMLTYKPNKGFSGLDTFTYRATDGDLWSQPIQFSIFVPEDPADEITETRDDRLDDTPTPGKPAEGASAADAGGCMAAGPAPISPLLFLLMLFGIRRRR